MSALENLTRKELQALAKEHGIRANMTSVLIIDKLKSKLYVPHDVPPAHVEHHGGTGVKWFRDGDMRFALGIELYEGGFPVVGGDKKRTYIKVYMRGLPHTKLQTTDVICQLFYLSSGSNSSLGGLWLPSNVMTLRFSQEGGTRLWKWYIQKKPWFIGKSSNDGYNPAMRFGGDPCIAMVSLILGGFRTKGKVESAIDTLKVYVMTTLERHLVKILGKKKGRVAYKDMDIYYTTMSGIINKYLLSMRSIRPKCDDYDLDMWTGKCTSYNWFAPFDKKYPDYIPNLDPLDKDSLWRELPPSKKLFLNSSWLDNPEKTMQYIKDTEQADEDFPSAKTPLDKVRARAKWVFAQRMRSNLFRGKLPDNLASREQLLSR